MFADLTMGAILNTALDQKHVSDQDAPVIYSRSAKAGEHSDLEFAQQVARLVENPICQDNRLRTMINGEAIFPAMLCAISEAKTEILFETFVYWSGSIAEEFADALCDAAKRGVEVCVLLDWWGAHKMEEAMIEKMRSCGVKAHYFNPLHWWQMQRLNYRTHRKILVIDKAQAFAGGVGIADNWRGNARSPEEWHDLHYRIEGPITAYFRQAFEELWPQRLAPIQTNPGDAQETSEAAGHSVPAQTLWSSPRKGSQEVYRVLRYAVEEARDSVQLMTAYFVPDDTMMSALTAAAKRGVSVDVMVPGPHIDSNIVRYSSRSSWGRLLRAGVHIHVYQPTMLHAKLIIIDKRWTMIGSANFDYRSFSLNDEIIVNVFSVDFAKDQTSIFEDDLTRCLQLSYADWRHRGLASRCKEVLSDFMRSLL